jgi:hypothetical protein
MRNKKSTCFTGFMFSIVLFIIGCTRQDMHRELVQQQGKSRAKGQPSGLSVSRMIDVSGGRVVSGDGRVTLIIPPGAVASPTTIRIQPINSTLPLSLAASYRMEPEGEQFLLPVTIQFAYTAEQVANSLPELLFISYQDTTGVWRALKNSQVDTASKTISAGVSHFSDWTVFEEYRLFVSSNAVAPNETVNLHVVRNFILDGNPVEYILADTSSDYLEPLINEKVDNWQLFGQGTFTHNKGFASYSAPAATPVPNPVHISVDLLNVYNNGQTRGKVTLITSIKVQEEYMSLTLGSKTYTSHFINTSTSSVSSLGGGASVNITTASLQEGSFTFGNIGGSTALVSVSLDASPAKPFGIFYFTGCPNPDPAQTTGTVVISQYGDIGQYIEGSFSGTLVSSVDCNNEFQPVSGSFRVRRK